MGCYDNQKCDGCGENLKPDDDIVVCHICGTPQHRECFQKQNACVNAEKHSEGFAWKPEKVEEEVSQQDKNKKTYANAVKLEKRCPHCNENMAGDTLFCPNCHKPVFDEQVQSQNPNMVNINPFMGIPNFNPYGGVSPDEKIDDLTVTEIAEYVQSSTHYYIPKFKRFFKKKNLNFTWNWAAFLLGYLWFFFRKNYFWGAIIGLVQLGFALYSLPFINEYTDIYNQFMQNQTSTQLMGELQEKIVPMMILMAVAALIRVGSCLIANKIYYKNAIRKIKEIKKETDSKDEFVHAVRRAGGASIFVMMLAFLTSNVLSSVLQMFLN